MPNRILKESICTSDEIDKLTAFQETVFYRLIVNCDDYGRMDARPSILASKLFPLKRTSIRENQIEDALRALTSADLVSVYRVHGKPILQMNTWDRHQTIRAKQPKYPGPDEADAEVCKQMQSDASNCKQMHADACRCSRNPIQSNTGLQSESEYENSTRRRVFSPPSVEDVAAYVSEKGYSVDAEAFVAYYESKGWKVGSSPMKDWKAAVVTWQKREYTGKMAGGNNNPAAAGTKESSAGAIARLIREGAFNE